MICHGNIKAGNFMKHGKKNMLQERLLDVSNTERLEMLQQLEGDIRASVLRGWLACYKGFLAVELGLFGAIYIPSNAAGSRIKASQLLESTFTDAYLRPLECNFEKLLTFLSMYLGCTDRFIL